MSQHQDTSTFDNIQASLQQIMNLTQRYFKLRAKKRKRNQKTCQQYQRKQAQAKAQRVTVQEVEHSYGQEVEHLDIQIGVGKTSKHEAYVKSEARCPRI